MCRLPISIIGKMRSFRYWRARSSFRSAITPSRERPEPWSSYRAMWPLVHNRIGAEPDAHSAYSRRA